MKRCPNCYKSFDGRKNQIYCSLECKIEVNNARARERAKYAKQIDTKLRQSRNALLRLCEEKSSILVTRNQLIIAGYSFKFFTHEIRLKDGQTGRAHYDFAVFPVGDKYKIQYLYG